MAPIDAAAILQLWEEVRDRATLDRSIALCARAEPPVDFDTAATMPLGQRNARLLRLRLGWSDADVEMTAECPRCAATLEFAVSPDVLLESAELAAIRPLEIGSRVIHWRPVSSLDLVSAAGQPDAASAAAALIECCIEEIVEDGHALAVGAMTEAERAALAAAVEAADPLCSLLFDLTCIDCGQPVSAELDVPLLVWRELDHRARRVVSEIHALATAYGWTEAECLSLTPARRSIYLEWVGGP